MATTNNPLAAINLGRLSRYDQHMKGYIEGVKKTVVFFEPTGNGDDITVPTTDVNDEVTSNSTTWSSEKITQFVEDSKDTVTFATSEQIMGLFATEEPS